MGVVVELTADLATTMDVQVHLSHLSSKSLFACLCCHILGLVLKQHLVSAVRSGCPRY